MNIVGISGNLNSGKDTVAKLLVEEFDYVQVALADPIKRYALKVFHFSEDQLWGPSHFRNELDPRFQSCDSPDEGDDAWMAVYRRAERLNKKFVTEMFPDSPLLQATAMGKLKSWLKGLSKEHPQVSPRIVLQTLGTEFGRSVHPDVWIRMTLRVSSKLLGGGYAYDHSEGLSRDPSAKPQGVVISDIRFPNELAEIKKVGGFLIRIKRPQSDHLANVVGVTNHKSEMHQSNFDDSDFNFIIFNDKTLEDLEESVRIAGMMLEGRQ